MICREAVEGDLFEMCKIAEEFVKESTWPVTFCFGTTLQNFTGYINEPNACVMLVVNQNDRIVGGALLFAAQDFHFETFGYIGKFFIRSDDRNTSAASRLIKACNFWFEERNVVVSFVTATAGISERANKAFTRIMERAGYEQDAPILIRKYDVEDS